MTFAIVGEEIQHTALEYLEVRLFIAISVQIWHNRDTEELTEQTNASVFKHTDY